MPLFDSAGPPAPAGQPSEPGAPLAAGTWVATPREPLLVRIAGRWWYPYELAAVPMTPREQPDDA